MGKAEGWRVGAKLEEGSDKVVRGSSLRSSTFPAFIFNYLLVFGGRDNSRCVVRVTQYPSFYHYYQHKVCRLLVSLSGSYVWDERL